MNERISIKARYKSYCYVCEHEINIGDHLTLSYYLSEINGESSSCWRHLKCA